MKLISAEDFAREYFVGGHSPDPRTVRAWVRAKKLPGLEMVGRVLVDVDAVQQLTTERPAPTSSPSRKTIYRI